MGLSSLCSPGTVRSVQPQPSVLVLYLTTAQKPWTEAQANLSLSYLKFFVSDILT